MNFENVIQYLSNKTILITGATGFLGKILVEKILRVQPDVTNLYLLIRAKDIRSAQQRLQDEVLRKDLFRVLRNIQGDKFDSFISEKVTIITGDTSLPDLGMNDSIIREDMYKNIDAIMHVAATTKFNERYDLALSINTLGPLNVLNFAKKCPKLQILVHVSTAYVSHQNSGLINEKPFKMGDKLNEVPGELNIDAEKRLIARALDDLTSKGASQKDILNAMKSLGQKRASFYGWANTYVFTKAMGEMRVGQLRGNLPIIIVRPTIVSGTYKEPFPGWIEGFGSLSSWTIAVGKGFAKFVHAHEHTVLDLIPADMVVNAMITAMVAHANKPSLTVYHVGSSLRNPVSLHKVMGLHFQYFNKKPWIDEHGMLEKVPSHVRARSVRSKSLFVILLILQLPKLLALIILAKIVTCNRFKVKYDKRKLQLMANVKLVDRFKHFLFFTGIFDDQNTEKLRATMRKNGKLDEDVLYFDPKYIDWNEYLLNKHIPGVVKYLF